MASPIDVFMNNNLQQIKENINTLAVPGCQVSLSGLILAL